VSCLALSAYLPCKSDGFSPPNSFPHNSEDQRQQLTDCHRDFIFSSTGAVRFHDFCLTFPQMLHSWHHFNLYDTCLMAQPLRLTGTRWRDPYCVEKARAAQLTLARKFRKMKSAGSNSTRFHQPRTETISPPSGADLTGDKTNRLKREAWR